MWRSDGISSATYGGLEASDINRLKELEHENRKLKRLYADMARENTALRGQPKAIRLDNGPEFIAERFMAWCAERAIELRHIQPGKPDQKAFIERYNRTYRTEVLKASVFESLEQVREITAEWLQRYNEERPLDALAGLPLATYRANLQAGSSPLKVSP